MIKIIVSIGLLFSVNLFASLVDDGTVEYNNGNKKKAIELYSQACDGGNTHGCIKLGFLYAAGDGVSQDTKKAKKIFVEACKAKYSKACFGLGVLYKQGSDGVKKDIKKALMAFNRACYIGDERGCEQYNLLNTEPIP